MQIATAYVELRVDTKKARSEAVAETKKLGKDMGSELNRALADAFSVAAFSKAVSGVISSASRLEQAVGGTAAVFKQSSTVIDEFAKTSAKAFGLSSSAARELTAQTGALLKGLGFTTAAAADQSVVMAKLGADLSAAFGGSPEEAVQALGAALRGEFNPAERFGVSLTAASVAAQAVKMGLADTASSVDGYARAQATLALITEQSVDVQGQYAREADTAAGAASRMRAELEDQRAEIGNALLPVYARTVDMIGSMVGVFADLPAPIQTGIIALGGMAAMAGPVGRVVDVATSLRGALTKMSPTMVGVGGVVTAAAVLYGMYADRKNEATEQTKKFTDALIAEAKGQKGALEESISTDLTGSGLAKIMEEIGFSAAEATRVIMGEAVPAFEELERLADLAISGSSDRDLFGAEATRLGITATGDEIIRLVDKLNLMEEGLVDSRREFALIEDVTEGVTGAFQDMDDKAGDAGVAAKDLAAKVGEIDVSFSEAADRVTMFQQALEAVMGGAIGMEEANRAIREEIDALTASVLENGATLDINTEAGRKNREQAQAAAESVLDVAEAMVRSGSSMKEAENAAKGLRDMLLVQMETLGFTREEAEAYLTTLDLTPESIETSVKLTKQDIAIAKINEILATIPDNVPTEIEALIDEGRYAEALRRLEKLTKPRTVTINASYSGFMDGGVYDSGGGYGRPEDDDESKAGRESQGPAVVGGTRWWQQLMGLYPTGGGTSSSSSSGPSPQRVAFDREFERAKRRYSLGDITPAEYLAELQAMRRKYGWPRLSDPGYALAQEIERARKDEAEANVKDPGDPIGAAFDQAAADQAAIEARQNRRSARRQAIATAMDPNASGADKKRAEEAWAQAILDDLDARANAKGMADRTVPWARFVRRGLEEAAKKTPALRDEISVLLAGIPDFSSDAPGGGGTAPPGPSGTTPAGGNSGTNRAASGPQPVLPGAGGLSGPIIAVFGTERQYVDQLRRMIRQQERGNR